MLNTRKKYAVLCLFLITLISCGSDKKPETKVDTIPPAITLNGDSSISLNKGDEYTELGATATDNIDTSVQVVVSGEVNINAVGKYQITYTATDSAGNQASTSRSVTVNSIPEIALNGESSLTWYLNDEFIDPGAKATDETDGTLDVTVVGTVDVTQLGQYSLIYQATNSAGNAISIEREVQVIDSISFTLNGEATLSITLSESYHELGAIAMDRNGNQLEVTINDNINTEHIGAYTVTYTVVENDVQRTLLRNVNVLPKSENTFTAFANLNKDQSLDLAVVTYTGSKTDLVWRSGFSEANRDAFVLIDSLSDELPLALNAHDLNNSGSDDLLVVTEKGWYVYYNQGNGNFEKSVNLTNSWAPYDPNSDPNYVVGFSQNMSFIPKAVYIEDVSGDGIADLIWETEHMTANYMDGYSTFSLIYTSIANSDFAYPEIKRASSGYSTQYIAGSGYQYVSESHNIKFHDVNQDNITNLFKAIDRWNDEEIASPVPKSGRLVSIDINLSENTHNNLRSGTQVLDYEFVDWDRDGIQDIWLKQQTYTYQGPVFPDHKTSIEYILLPGEGNGIFSEEKDITTQFNDPSSILVDIDGDGQLDIVTNKIDEPTSIYWQKADNGQFKDEVLLISDSFPMSYVDLNNDNRPELIKFSEQTIAAHFSIAEGGYEYRVIFEFQDLLSITHVND